MPVLGALYRNAEWHLPTVPPVASDRAMHGWQGDPALWGRVLTNLPFQFERRDVKRYSPSRPEQEQ